MRAFADRSAESTRARLALIQTQQMPADVLERGTALKHISRHLLGLYQGEPGARGFRRTISEGAHLPGAGWGLIEQALAPCSVAA